MHFKDIIMCIRICLSLLNLHFLMLCISMGMAQMGKFSKVRPGLFCYMATFIKEVYMHVWVPNELYTGIK